MDSGHRHELKTNELADWVAHAPQYLRDNSRTIIGISLIVIGLLTWPMFSERSKNAKLNEQAEVTGKIEQVDRSKMIALRNQMQDIDMPNTFLDTANSLDVAASETKNKSLSALALINRAEALRADLHYRAEEVDRDVVATQIVQVRESYQKAMEKADSNPTIKGMAQYGLALCAEETGNFDEAETIYSEIAQSSEYAGTVLPARAEMRLQIIEENKQHFVFVDAPVIEAQPEISLPGAGLEDVFQRPVIEALDIDASPKTDPEETVTEQESENSEGGQSQ